MREIKWKETSQEREYGIRKKKKNEENIWRRSYIAIECRGSVCRKHAGDPAERTNQHSCLMNAEHRRNSKENKKNIVNWSIYTECNRTTLNWISVWNENYIRTRSYVADAKKGTALSPFFAHITVGNSGAEKIKTRTVVNLIFFQFDIRRRSWIYIYIFDRGVHASIAHTQAAKIRNTACNSPILKSSLPPLASVWELVLERTTTTKNEQLFIRICFYLHFLAPNYSLHTSNKYIQYN